MTKKNNNDFWIGFTLVVLLIIGCTWLIYSNTPKEVCHNEISIEKITLEPFCYDGFFGETCVTDVELIPDNAIEIICEEEIRGYFGDIVEYSGNETKVCLVKTSTEKCEVVYP